MTDSLAGLDEFLQEHWDPEKTLRAWWSELARSGWATPTWPTEWFGRGLSVADASAANRRIVAAGAIPGPGSFGAGMVGPTLCVHGDEAQRRRYLWDIASGVTAWCQLFSEPGAGSDLAGLQTRAERDGDGWVVNGQKVWTTAGQIADRAILLARTNVDVPKHRGISFFVIDMRQPGVEVRPLREMTGRSFFNQVFLTDARVDDADLVGGEGAGWTVANTTLGFERAMSGAPTSPGGARPGSIAGDLDRPAGQLTATDSPSSDGPGPSRTRELTELARRDGGVDPTIRDRIARLWSLERIIDLTAQRNQAEAAAGRSTPGAPNLAKMAQNRALRLQRDLTFEVLGPAGQIFDYTADSRTDHESNRQLVEAALFAQGPQIYGGSEQIQRNIVGDRVLLLPREPREDPTRPFRDTPRSP